MNAQGRGCNENLNERGEGERMDMPRLRMKCVTIQGCCTGAHRLYTWRQCDVLDPFDRLLTKELD